MKLITDNETLLRILPNQIAAVKGECSLYEKIYHFLDSSEKWAIDTFFSEDTFNAICEYEDSNYIKTLTYQLVVTEALRCAIPSLDIVLTPNGFGIVSNNTIAAASKQRVDRLIGAMMTLRDEAISRLLPELVGFSGWLETAQAHYFGSSLFHNLAIVDFIPNFQGSKWDKFKELRPQLIELEDSLAEEYFSPESVSLLRENSLRGSLTFEQEVVANGIRNQIIGYLNKNTFVSQRLRDLVNYIRLRPDDFPLWHSSDTAKLFSPPKFVNKKESKGYWF